MGSRFVVDKQEGLKELRQEGLVPQPKVVKWGSVFFSYLFHPVFIPVWVVWFMLYKHPYLFAGFSSFDKTKVMIQAIVMFAFFPVVTVWLLKALKFVNSFHLRTQKDRVIPLIACGIWYFWIWNVWRNLPNYPREAVQLALAIWISVSIALMVNIVIKISLHTIAAGVMLTFMVLLALFTQINLNIYVSVAFLITGIVCTSRFIVSDHTPAEVYSGLALGFASMLTAWQF